MKLELRRFHGTKGYTAGELFIDDLYFCNTIEDEERESKEYAKTAIPLGTYEITVNMSIRFKKLMPLLHNVPNFTGIRIHSGNSADDSEGCILVGKPHKKDFITESRVTFTELMKKINQARVKEKVTITIL
jgi:hypothetical protein